MRNYQWPYPNEMDQEEQVYGDVLSLAAEWQDVMRPLQRRERERKLFW